MMKRCIYRLFVFILCLVAALWMVTKTDSFQRKATSFASLWLSRITESDVTVGKVEGYLPFFISLSNIKVQKQNKELVSIDTLKVSPLWLDLPFDSLSFLYFGAQGISLSDTFFDDIGKTSSPSNLPTIHIWHFSFTDVQIPAHYSKPLLNQWFQDIDVEVLYSLSGRLGYTSKKKSFYTACTSTVSCKDVCPAQLQATLESTQEKTLLSFSLDINNPPTASVFINTFLDRISLSGTLEGKGLSSGLKGSWQAMGSYREQKTAPLSTLVTMASKGSLEIFPSKLDFTTNSFTCFKNIPKFRPEEDRDLYFSETPAVQFDVVSIPIQGELHGSLSPNELLLQSGTLSFNGTTLSSFLSKLQIDASGGGHFCFSTLLKQDVKTVELEVTSDWKTGQNHEFSLDNISMRVDDFSLKGALHGALYPFSLQGGLSSNTTDTSKIAPFFGLQPCGRANLSITFSSEHSPYPIANVSLECRDLAGQEIVLDKIALGASIPLTEHSESKFSLEVEGKKEQNAFYLNSQGTFEKNIHDTNALLTFKAIVAAFGEHECKNEEPLVIALKDRFLVEPFILRLKNGSCMYGSLECSKELLSGSLTLENIPLELLLLFSSKVPAKGALCGKLDLLGTPNTPLMHGSFSSTEFHVGSFNQPLRASFLAEFQENICELALDIEPIGSEELGSGIHCKAHIPLVLSLDPFYYKLLEKEAFDIECSSAIKENALYSTLLEDPELLSGNVELTVNAFGTLEHPQFRGSGTWQNGHLFIPIIGCRFANIEMQASLEKDKLIITNCSGTDDEKGTFSANGWIEPSWKALAYQLSVQFSNFYAVSLSDLQVHTDASLTLEGDLTHALLKGTASVNEASILLTSQGTNELPQIDVVYVHQGEDTPKKAFEFATDIDIHVPKTGKVMGMGFDSLWEGAIHLRTQEQSLFLHGALHASQAKLEVANKVFQVTHADIDFQGPLSDSKLLIIASNQEGPVTTQILIRGSVEAPKIDFQSIPALSQKEVLSWIFFSKSSTEISPFEGLQLAQMLLKLQRTPSQNIDIFEKIKSTLHIDRIDVNSANRSVPTNSLGNEVSVGVGKYISKGLVVTLSKDVSNEVNRIGIEANIANNIIATANVGDDAQAQLSIEWKVNY